MKKFSAFDTDLTFIASEAAFEVDNMIVENPSDLRSAKTIMLSICKAISDKDGSLNVDSYTFHVLRQSLETAKALPAMRDFFLELSKEHAK